MADTGIRMTEPAHGNLERREYHVDTVDTVKSCKAIRRKKIIAIDVDCESVDDCFFDTCTRKIVIGI